ncbi:hypothetical protein [Pseudomonas sp.]|uniref:hypothetical protein n=1 Tax=Pseudomonas sp. TaxID=306 RepID=UPI002911D7D0|nr:hypothetical protein [Pseudomonas sp.]MDU4254476.1 hypothetical protein [Pseudomonas sp.]
MARKAQRFHSEFSERFLLTVRAPEGDSFRAAALRRLVAQMDERYQTGQFKEWLIDAMLDKMLLEEQATGGDVARIVELQSLKRGTVQQESAVVQRSEGRAEPGAPEHSPDPEQVLEPVPVPAVEVKPERPKAINPGLRVMG